MTMDAGAQITDLRATDHACLTFGEDAELFDLTAAFVRDGLTGGMKVVWLTDSAPGRALSELARRGLRVGRAMAAGQMVTATCDGQLLSDQAFAADHATRWLGDQLDACAQAGFAGLRIAVDMSWALRPIAGVEQLISFEEGAATLLASASAAASASMLCHYDRERFDPVTLAAVAARHTCSVAAATYYADAVLRICRQYAPPGVRLAGEIDYRAEEPLAIALGDAIRIDGDIAIDMTDLAFIDASCMRMIVNAARSMTAPRRVVLRCPPGVARRLALIGAADVPTISLVTVRER